MWPMWGWDKELAEWKLILIFGKITNWTATGVVVGGLGLSFSRAIHFEAKEVLSS